MTSPASAGGRPLDITHKFAVCLGYELPNISTRTCLCAVLAHGWEWGGTYLAESGQPVTPLSGVDSNVNGDTPATVPSSIRRVWA